MGIVVSSQRFASPSPSCSFPSAAVLQDKIAPMWAHHRPWFPSGHFYLFQCGVLNRKHLLCHGLFHGLQGNFYCSASSPSFSDLGVCSIVSLTFFSLFLILSRGGFALSHACYQGDPTILVDRLSCALWWVSLNWLEQAGLAGSSMEQPRSLLTEATAAGPVAGTQAPVCNTVGKTGFLLGTLLETYGSYPCLCNGQV